MFYSVVKNGSFLGNLASNFDFLIWNGRIFFILGSCLDHLWMSLALFLIKYFKSNC